MKDLKAQLYLNDLWRCKKIKDIQFYRGMIKFKQDRVPQRLTKPNHIERITW